MKLSDNTRRVIRPVAAVILEEGRTPRLSEVAEGLGITAYKVFDSIRDAESKGLARVSPHSMNYIWISSKVLDL